MLTLLFVIFALAFAGRIVIWALKAAWGITRVVFTVAFFPIILVGVILLGLVKIALPLVIIALIASLIVPARRVV